MRLLKSVSLALIVASLPIASRSGTTGGITGRIIDVQNHGVLAGVTVTASSPSQVARSVTDATGTYRFLSLAPDTYTLSFAKEGYDPITQPGLTVVADQVQTYNTSMVRTLRTIAHVTAQSAASLVKRINPEARCFRARCLRDVRGTRRSACRGAQRVTSPLPSPRRRRGDRKRLRPNSLCF